MLLSHPLTRSGESGWSVRTEMAVDSPGQSLTDFLWEGGGQSSGVRRGGSLLTSLCYYPGESPVCKASMASQNNRGGHSRVLPGERPCCLSNVAC